MPSYCPPLPFPCCQFSSHSLSFINFLSLYHVATRWRWMDTSTQNLVQMSKLVMAHRCWKGIKRFITYIMRFSRESRAGFKAYLKMSWENRKGPLTWGSVVLRKWDSSEGSLHGPSFHGLIFPSVKREHLAFFLACPGVEQKEKWSERAISSQISKIESYCFPLLKWELHSFPEQHYLSRWVKEALPSYNFNRTIPHLPFPEKLKDTATCLLLGCQKK